MCSTYNEGESVNAGRFIRTYQNYQNKIFKCITAISKNVYINYIVNEYGNTYRTIKVKPFNVENKDSKFKIGDHVRISKYKNIFSKSYTPNLSEEVFVI